jgi:hypothetical protein
VRFPGPGLKKDRDSFVAQLLYRPLKWSAAREGGVDEGHNNDRFVEPDGLR